MIDVRKAIETGEWDAIGIAPLPTPMCDQTVRTGIWDEVTGWSGRCSYEARFITITGRRLCPLHARKFAHDFTEGRADA